MANSQSITAEKSSAEALVVTSSSLKTLLADYRSAYREYGKALRAVDVLDEETVDPTLRAAATAAEDRYAKANRAMIDAPVTTFGDIALKLRFYFEVGGDPKMFDEARSWEDQIAKNILRDIGRAQVGGTTLRSLRRLCTAGGAAAPALAALPAEATSADRVTALASALAGEMAGRHGGTWTTKVDHDSGFVLIMPHGGTP